MRSARAIFAVVAVLAIAVAFARTVDDAEGIPLPPLWRLLIVAALIALGLVAALGAWARLVPTAAAFDLAPGFFLAQLAKYVPGSVWQGVGQVMDAVRLGIGKGTAAVAYVVQMATQTVAGAVIAGLVLVGRPSGWLFAAGVLAPLSIVFLNRNWMQAALRLASRVAPGRLGHLPGTVPGQAAILQATALSLVTMITMSLAYALVLPGALEMTTVFVSVGAFALAWVVGLLVLPVPSGLGIREFLLVAALAGAHGTAAVLAAAIILRLVVIVVEALLAAGSRIWLPSSTRPRPL